MSDGVMAGQLPPAGWHPDPAGTPQERWWDGTTWTDYLRDTPTAPPAPPEPPAPSESAAIPEYQPMSSWPSAASPAEFVHTAQGSPNTPGIWMIAFYPLFALPLRLLPGTGMLLPDLVLILVILGLALAYSVIGVVWDHLALRSRNLPAASPFWLFLTLVGYLVARRVALRRGGIRHHAPSNVFVLLLILNGVIYGYYTFTFGNPQQDSYARTTVENYITTELESADSADWQTTCPPDARFSVPGSQMQCTSLASDGRALTFIATLGQGHTFTVVQQEQPASG